ncbi:MAG: hypothetical protein NC915_05690 [Candidatus Omnitrophica bacterium]|nr:hypothetical protein [Candidatus Omnitrophota bacterium]
MKEIVKIRPYQLLCILCKLKTGFDDNSEDLKFKKILNKIKKNPERPIMLITNVLGSYSYQNPKNTKSKEELFRKKRDLDILRSIGLFPGAIMPARSIIEKIINSIESPEQICKGNIASEIWRPCEYLETKNYGKLKETIHSIFPVRSLQEREKSKKLSVEKMYKSKLLMIRPHHLMCMVCFSESKNEPILEDNLYEAIDIIRKNPEIPIKLIEGPCMICPPCSAYIPEKNLCVGGFSMNLRDEKKDIDVLFNLDMNYGMILPARQLFKRLFERIKSAKEICGYGDCKETSPEWRICGNVYKKYYEEGRKKGMGIPGIKVKDG